MALIRVLNPNSNQDVTDGLAEAVAGFAIPAKIEITCATLASGPFGIQTQRDVDSVAVPLVDNLKSHPADAHVIACYSDPGLALARTEIDAPVFGIQDSGIAMALTRGDRFGVIAVADGSIPRHLRAIRTMGVGSRLAAERALNLTVAETAGDAAYAKLAETGSHLCTHDGADVLILGCAGMARHRARLENELGVPVIDPAQAAVSHAMGALLA